MNRIYIIGNGFDISHGLPTSYNDFVEYLIKKEVFSLIDGLPKNFTKNNLKHIYLGELIINDREMNNYLRANSFYSLGGYEIMYFDKLKNEINSDPVNSYNRNFKRLPENEFINEILDSSHFLWGKIEIQYFELLKKYHEEIEYNKSNLNDVVNKVEQLNNNLEYIKNELAMYLTHVQNVNKKDYNESDLSSILEFSINEKTSEKFYKINKSLVHKINLKMNSYLFLNFNYTDTISYLSKKCSINSSTINIHGDIKNPNDIIFGFGDENTNEYRDIENSEDVFLENIKSFKYLKNNKYDKLIGFLDCDYYEVNLLGHSCAITDRVLLKKIFENKHCLTIKIIPKSGKDLERLENYNQILYNIARIFDDNGMMRDKVIPFEFCDISLPNIEKIKV